MIRLGFVAATLITGPVMILFYVLAGLAGARPIAQSRPSPPRAGVARPAVYGVSATKETRDAQSFCCCLAAALYRTCPPKPRCPVGAKAPDFTTTGAVGGKAFKLHLAEQLHKGPVVLYFFPKAFTSGCTAEAHAFSESIGDFKKAGAQVIGMSADNLATLKDFSVKECRSAFPVATATPATQKAYDVAWAAHPGITTRTSYVIDKSGKIVDGPRRPRLQQARRQDAGRGQIAEGPLT